MIPQPMTKDQLFLRFVVGLFVILGLFGTGMVIVILIGDHALAAKLVNVFSSMFTGTLGLATGYLLGKNGKNGSQQQ